MRNIVCVVPTIRPDSHAAFVKAWRGLFAKHGVTLITVWDGDCPRLQTQTPDDFARGSQGRGGEAFLDEPFAANQDLFCRRTDACRNIGFVAAAALNPTHVLTMDDDVHPVHPAEIEAEPDDPVFDPVQAHLDALDRRVPVSWTHTAHDTDLYLRGVPYGVRDEAPVMLSHGVWVGTPDFDGETQLRLEAKTCEACKGSRKERALIAPLAPPDPNREPRYVDCRFCGGTGGSSVPHSLPYYVGPIPRGVNFPLCGMNVMIRRAALPYFYFAPMGADSGVSDLHRFADIWMGVFLKREFDRLGWACYTGASTVAHTRASDARTNFEREKLGREWNELVWHQDYVESVLPGIPERGPRVDYLRSYADKRARYARLIGTVLGGVTPL